MTFVDVTEGLGLGLEARNRDSRVPATVLVAYLPEKPELQRLLSREWLAAAGIPVDSDTQISVTISDEEWQGETDSEDAQLPDEAFALALKLGNVLTLCCFNKHKGN